MDPNLFDASEASPFEQHHDGLANTPPPEPSFMTDASPQGDAAADRIFDEFVSAPDDDVNPHSEVAEAIEDRGRENEADGQSDPK